MPPTNALFIFATLSVAVTSSTSDTGMVMTSGRPKGPQVSNKSGQEYTVGEI